MTCGACSPKSMAPCYGADGIRSVVYGYTAGPHRLGIDVRDLYYFGAAHVFWDETLRPGQHVAHRPGLSNLVRRFLRPGDALLLPRAGVVGDRPSRQDRFISRLEAQGINVFIGTGVVPETDPDVIPFPNPQNHAEEIENARAAVGAGVC